MKLETGFVLGLSSRGLLMWLLSVPGLVLGQAVSLQDSGGQSAESFASGQSPEVAAEDAQVIQHVHVVDVEAGKILEHQQVMIRAGKIESLVPLNEASEPPAGVRIIDAKGRYLIPGLFDAHVHLVSDPELFAPMLVAHGVTSVRDLGGPTDMILAYKRAAAERAEPTPDITACGAIVDGNPPVWPFSETCETEEQAVAAVRKLAAAGVDQIKVYSLLKKDVYLAVVAEAKRLKLPVTGHVPVSVTIEQAVEAGQTGFEHLDGFAPLFERLVKRDSEAVNGERALVASVYEGWALWPRIDRQELATILRQHKLQNVVHVPTLVVMASIGRLADPNDDPRNDARLKYVSPATRAFWENGRYESFSPRALRAVPPMTELVGELHRSGITMAIGTDLANPYVFPGSSVHDEIERFGNAGIPAAEVLKMATINAAKLCGVDGQRGTIEVGKVASLVLLDENPLEDLSAVRKIRSVWLRGRYLDRESLDRILSEVERQAKGVEPNIDPSTPPQLPGEVILKGKYAMKFGPFDAGNETFIVSKAEDGFHTWTLSEPRGGGQVPAVVRTHFSLQGQLLSATYQPLSGAKSLATYRLDDGLMIGTNQSPESPPEVISQPTEGNFRISTPVYTTDFMFYKGLGLGVGQSTEIQSVGFGYPDWKPGSVKTKVRRADDETLEIFGKSWNAQVYHSSFSSPVGEMRTQTWLDDQGHTIKSVLKFPFGTVTATRQLD